MKTLSIVATVAMACGAAALATPASAAPPEFAGAGPTKIMECQIIDEPGSYVLVDNLPGDLGLLTDLARPAVDDCLLVDADNVTIDLNGFTIDGAGSQGIGIGSGVGTDVAGLLVPSPTVHAGITITNGTVRDFTFGIFLSGGPGHVVENMRISDNFERLSDNSGGALIVQVVGSRLTGNIVVNNELGPANGAVRVRCPSLVERNVVVENSRNEITATGGPPITDCVLDSNVVGPLFP